MNPQKIKKQIIWMLIVVLVIVFGISIWLGKTSGFAGYFSCRLAKDNNDIRC